MSTSATTNLVLYAGRGTPSPRRVCLTLAEKHLSFKIRWLNLALMDQKAPEYLALNPTGLVPTMVYGDRVIYESNVINEYLDALTPEPKLVPLDDYGKAKMRMWFAFENDFAKPFRDAVYETFAKDRLIATGVTVDSLSEEIRKRTVNPAYLRIAKAVLLKPRDDALLRDRIDIIFEKIGQLEARLGDGRPWLLGDHFTLADISLAPRLDMFPAIGITDLAVRFPRVGHLLAAVKARPSWAASDLQPEPDERERYVNFGPSEL